MINIVKSSLSRLSRGFSTLKYHLSRKASVSPEAYYQAVADTQRYSSFLPWCSRSVIVNKEIDWNDTILDIKFGFYSVSYKSRVTFSDSAKGKVIRSLCKQSPFKIIDSIWKVQKLRENLTAVNYQLQFEFVNPIYQQAASLFLSQAGEGMYHRFLSEALRLQSISRSKFTLEEFLKAHPELQQKLQNDVELMTSCRQLSDQLRNDPNYTKKLQQEIRKLIQDWPN